MNANLVMRIVTMRLRPGLCQSNNREQEVKAKHFLRIIKWRPIMMLRDALLIVTLGAWSSSGHASMSDFHKQGVAVAPLPKPGSSHAKTVPGYKGSSVPQSRLRSEELGSQALDEFKRNEAATLISDSLHQRPQYDIDPENDPLIKKADAIVTKPEASLKLKLKEGKESVTKTLHTCTKSQSVIERKCHWTLVPKKTGVKHEERQTTVALSSKDIFENGHFRVLFSTSRSYRHISPESEEVIQAFRQNFKGKDAQTGQIVEIDLDHIKSVKQIATFGPTITYQSSRQRHQRTKTSGPEFTKVLVTTLKEIPQFEYVWENDCQKLESLIDSENCEYAEKRCIEGPSTKVVEGVPLSADCWQEERTYRCYGKGNNTCQDLLNRGCVQISSKCKTQDGDECLEWEQTFECDEGNHRLSRSHLLGDKPFCLDGDCIQQSWAPNQDMADSLSKLALFKDLQKDMDPKTQTVFKGKDLKCSRLMLSFNDCCVKSGWGRKIGLASCNSQEKELAEQRKLDKCIAVGTYCAEKKLGVCIKKKTSFCCYASKMARLINEQGKKQLGLKFGSAKHPQCQGLSLSQITQLDFSKIDFSELFADITSKVKAPDSCKIQESLKKSMVEKSKITQIPSQTQGRSHGNF